MIEELQHGLKGGLGTTRAGPLRQGGYYPANSSILQDGD